MFKQLHSLNRFTELHLNAVSRVLVLIAALVMLLTYAFPLYHMTLKSNFYPEGLNLDIYSYKLASGDNNRDLKEINVLNHYIGMKAIEEQDIAELSWVPLVVGIIALLMLRVAFMGQMSALIDVTTLIVYFGVFSMYRFWKLLYDYGHNLDPKAAVRIEGFMPPLIGFKQIANFGVYNMPGIGAVLMILSVILLLIGIYMSRKQSEQE
jgi:copper chaperone NosL